MADMSSKDDNSIVRAVILLALILPGAAWSGFVLTRLWHWFVVPLGVPDIVIWQAAGLFIVAAWLSGGMTNDSDDGKKSGSERFVESIARMAIIPAFAWLFGAIYHALMVS